MGDHSEVIQRGLCEAVSRRRFLRALAGAGAALATRPISIFGGPGGDGSKAVASVARVVRVESERILPVRVVQEALLRDALATGLTTLTRQKTVADAWHQVLEPDDRILIKFNQSAATRIGTTTPVADALVRSLTASGWSPERIALLEVDGHTALTRQTARPDRRWQDRIVAFGRSGSDSFMAAVAECTAIINVPFLKTHHLATMTSCLKNLSHGLIRHPARFHAWGCDPAVGEIVASASIRERLRLNIVNGLRTVFDGGPDATAHQMHAGGTLLFGTDPVACDATGFGVLNEIRAMRELPPLLEGARLPRTIITAGQLGVGQADGERIDVVRL